MTNKDVKMVKNFKIQGQIKLSIIFNFQLFNIQMLKIPANLSELVRLKIKSLFVQFYNYFLSSQTVFADDQFEKNLKNLRDRSLNQMNDIVALLRWQVEVS